MSIISGMQSLQPVTRGIACRQVPRCLSRRAQRCFHGSANIQSGHSRWSTIKHDKGKNDALKNKQRSVFAQEIATCSKLFGPDPNANPKLADLITKAKRTGFAKQSIENAILRGQGKSASGAALEPLTIECILPSNIGCIIECETDSRLRTLADIKHAIKETGGNATAAGYLFSKKGKIVFEKKDGVGADEVFEAALEVGALDVDEDGEGRVVLFTETGDTKAAGETLSKDLGLDISVSEIVWDANEDTRVELESEDTVAMLLDFVDKIEGKEGGSVTGVYMNVGPGEKLNEDAWAELTGRLSA